ncbi:protein lin-52 homolog isoform X1 [Opisthocomus hoazin]|uniref:protein lin-52 homolog isoform X1 n=1 Tax=Opisthocomus hoazin TaxID=30419 RepID=UPI003F52CA6D
MAAPADGTDLEASLLSFEKLDRASPDLWPEQLPGVAEFAASFKSPITSSPPKWMAELENDDIDMLKELGSLTTANLMEKVRGLQNLAYQLGLDECDPIGCLNCVIDREGHSTRVSRSSLVTLSQEECVRMSFMRNDSQRNDSREIPEHPRETQKVAATCGVWTKIPQLDHLRIQMNPRTSKKDKAFAVDPQRQASLFASTAQLSTGQMYCIHRSQGLQLVALAFRLHLTKRCLTGLSPDVLWQSYLF